MLWTLSLLLCLAGLACVIGHNWPFYLRFRGGGRGAAPSIGVLLALMPLPLLLLVGPAIVAARFTRSILVGFTFLYAPL